jgi:hypothetical protein
MKWEKRLPIETGLYLTRRPTLNGQWIKEEKVFNPKYSDIIQWWKSFKVEYLDESTPSSEKVFTREDMKGFDAWKNTCGYKQDHISKFYWKAADPLQKQITFDQLLDLYLNSKQ